MTTAHNILMAQHEVAINTRIICIGRRISNGFTPD